MRDIGREKRERKKREKEMKRGEKTAEQNRAEQSMLRNRALALALLLIMSNEETKYDTSMSVQSL